MAVLPCAECCCQTWWQTEDCWGMGKLRLACEATHDTLQRTASVCRAA